MKDTSSRVTAGTRRKDKKEVVFYILPAVTVCALAISCLLGGCGSGGGGSGSGPDPDIHAESPIDAEVVIGTVREIGSVSQNPAILERDCGFSALFQGQSVWLFGDTLLNTPNTENVRMISNSLSCTFDIDAGDGIAGFSEEVDAVGAPATFFPLTEEEQAFNERHAGESCEEEPCNARWHIWPGTIIVDDVKGWAYIFYRKVLVGNGFFDFQHMGHSLAVWKDMSEPPERPVFDHIESLPTQFFGENGEPGFGTAAVVVDREVFVYGCELGEDKLTKPCHVARVPLADILDRNAWSFYSGGGKWSSESLQSQVIFSGNDMMSVFFNPYLNRFVAIYSEHLGATAMLRTAVHPEGPWSAPIALFSVDAPENPNGWVYDFLAHPEFSQDNGRIIYITYSKKIDGTYSELRLLAVELERSP
jgi:hypothetical protein